MPARGQENLAWRTAANPRSHRWTAKVNKACPICGEVFATTEHRISRGMGKYCSRDCFNKSKIGTPTGRTNSVTVRCLECQSEFTVQKSRVMAGRGKFCSKSCNSAYRSKHDVPWNKGKKWPEMQGENNPAWKGGTATEYELIKGSSEYKLWRKAVVARDSFTCQGCGSKKNLHAHHILQFSTQASGHLQRHHPLQILPLEGPR